MSECGKPHSGRCCGLIRARLSLSIESLTVIRPRFTRAKPRQTRETHCATIRRRERAEKTGSQNDFSPTRRVNSMGSPAKSNASSKRPPISRPKSFQPTSRPETTIRSRSNFRITRITNRCSPENRSHRRRPPKNQRPLWNQRVRCKAVVHREPHHPIRNHRQAS